MKNVWFIILWMLCGNFVSAQHSYSPAAGTTGSTAMHKDSTVFVAWATKCALQRGWQNIADKSLGKVTVGDSAKAFGKAGNAVVSLGDSGNAVLQFDGYIFDGVGADFAVFENGFKNRNGGDFLELAFVEVSSDGKSFYRFPAHSLTDTAKSLGSFGTIDPTKINNLAGKYYANYGTPFDLAELKGINGLDIQKITHVKIVDVVGSLNQKFAAVDTANRIIVDPYPTAFPSGGFDLDAVGVVHLSAVGLSKHKIPAENTLYPNPSGGVINIPQSWVRGNVHIYNAMGQEVFRQQSIGSQLHVSELDRGIYFVHLSHKNLMTIEKIMMR